MSRTRTAIALLALAAIAPLSACSAVADAAAAATAPAYAGTDLAQDVERVVADQGVVIQAVTCADADVVEAGKIVDCEGTVEGERTGIRVTFDDAEGHFTLEESSL